jgi:hypothetical protein
MRKIVIAEALVLSIFGLYLAAIDKFFSARPRTAAQPGARKLPRSPKSVSSKVPNSEHRRQSSQLLRLGAPSQPRSGKLFHRPHRARLHRQHKVRGASHFNSGDFIPETILHHSS